LKRIARQRGAVGALVLVVFVLVMLGLAASYLLSRVDNTTADRKQTLARLAKAAEALDAFAGTARRLPCPADPALDTGEELLPAPNSVNCSFPTATVGGTMPWKTIGLRRDDAYDAWGRKLSYRVFAGGTGLTQIGGASMVDCDTHDAPTAPTGVGLGGLCVPNADIYLKSSSPASFIAGKGLSLNDSGTAYTDVAFVVVSHGATGFGGYSGSGARVLPLPVSVAESNHNNASGPFTIRAFSDSETGPSGAQHFDDLLAYRRISDLARRSGLAARDWPEGAIFNSATMQAAIGSSAYGVTSVSSFNFAGNTYTAVGSGSSRISFSTSGGVEGIGVDGPSGGENFLTTSEYIRIDLGLSAGKVGIALNGFSALTVFSTRYREQVQVRFFNGGTAVGSSVVRQGCRDGTGLATFTVMPTIPGQTFNRLEIQPMDVSPPILGIDSSFLVSEFAACSPSSSSCTVTLATSANTCAMPTVAATAFSPTTIAVGGTSVLTLTITNGTDDPAHGGMALTLALPNGLAPAASPSVESSCPAGASFIAVNPAMVSVSPAERSVSLQSMAIAGGVHTCAVRFNVSGSMLGDYAVAIGNLSKTANVMAADSSPATLEVQ
jgi:hypothetical protein